MPCATLILLTAVQSLDTEQLEAAQNGGAPYYNRVWFIVLPHLSRAIAVVILLNFILAWHEAFWPLNLTARKGRTAHGHHRELFQTRGPVLRKTLGSLDKGDCADPDTWMVQPETTSLRPEVRRCKVGKATMGRIELKKVLKSFGATELNPPLDLMIEDGEFPMRMADKIDALQAVVIEQVGTLLELDHTPRNKFVACFIRAPKMNLTEGTEATKHDARTIGIRPEHLTVSTTSGDWQDTVGIAEHLGSDTFIHIHGFAGCDTLTVRAAGDLAVSQGDTIYLTPNAALIHKFDAHGLRMM